MSDKGKLILAGIIAFVVFLILITPKEKEDPQESNLIRLSGEGGELEEKSEKRGPRQLATGYEGTILAGKEAPYIQYNQKDYEKAVSEGKTIALIFCPDWSERCKAEESEVFRGFNLLGKDHLIGFRVNMSDDNTEDVEKALADQNRISSDNTKVIIQDGRQIYKSTERWDAFKLLEIFGSL